MSDLSTFSAVMAFLAEQIPPVVAAPPAYPFVGQKVVKAILETEGSVQEAVVAMLYFLQTDKEQALRNTEQKNKAGFMSSDAWHGTLIGEKLANGAELSDEDRIRIPRIACKYAKQLTVQLRREAMCNDPKLAAWAGVFSVR
jgi:hypothetical protein